MRNGMQKYTKYLTIKHNWKDNNCATIIRDIYKEHLNIDLNDIFSKDVSKLVNEADTNWYKNWGKTELHNELKQWTKINLHELREYDILIFISKNSGNMHFGMYLESNTFIHLKEGQYVTLGLLDDVWRKLLYGCYRHNELV